MYTEDKDATAAQAGIDAALGLAHVAYIIIFLSQFLPQLFGYARNLVGTLSPSMSSSFPILTLCSIRGTSAFPEPAQAIIIRG